MTWFYYREMHREHWSLERTAELMSIYQTFIQVDIALLPSALLYRGIVVVNPFFADYP